MVKFRLVEENDLTITYWYFPEGMEDEGYGVIVIGKKEGIVRLSKLAPNDYLRTITAAEQNSLIDSINTERDEIIPYEDSDVTYSVYGSHAMNYINDNFEKGNILKEGIVAWY